MLMSTSERMRAAATAWHSWGGYTAVDHVAAAWGDPPGHFDAGCVPLQARQQCNRGQFLSLQPCRLSTKHFWRPSGVLGRPYLPRVILEAPLPPALLLPEPLTRLEPEPFPLEPLPPQPFPLEPLPPNAGAL